MLYARTVVPSLLILDDDLDFTAAAGELARMAGFDVHIAHTLAAARALLEAHAMQLMLLDLTLPDGSGMDLAEQVDLSRHGQIVVVTGQPSIESAARAVASPVVDYLVKPLQPQQFETLLRRTLRRDAPPAPALEGLASLVGASPPILELKAMLARIAPSTATVLLAGESGTGKEVVAEALHTLSGRSGRFVAVNCGAIASELLASQLFGHERGAFTGAAQRHAGFFEQAAHGTLFLDEITEMSMALQVYLLRVLESGQVRRVGGSELIDTPVRVIAATNRDPLAAIAQGRLREDLYYRLADIPLTLPPLRERGGDITLLARMFIDRLNATYGVNKRLDARCIPGLLRHAWPGNVRELRSAVQRAYLLERSDDITVQPALPPSSVWHETDTSLTFAVGTPFAEMERRMLLKTLAYCNNDKTATARALGISVRTVHNQLARLHAEGGALDPVEGGAGAGDVAA